VKCNDSDDDFYKQLALHNRQNWNLDHILTTPAGSADRRQNRLSVDDEGVLLYRRYTFTYAWFKPGKVFLTYFDYQVGLELRSICESNN
jgi:hypothetical protein